MEFNAAYGYNQLRGHIFQVVVALVVLIVLVKFIPALWKTYKRYLAFKNVPYVPHDLHWLLGHAPEYLQDLMAAILKASKYSFQNNHEILGINLGPLINQLYCYHPDAVKLILKSDPKCDEFYYPFLPWFGKSILVSNGDKWLRSRRLLTPAFHYDILRPYVKVYAEAVGETIDLWKQVPEGESVDVYPYMSQLTLDIMLRCTCSYRSNCQITKSHVPYVSAVAELTQLITKRTLSFHQYSDLIYFFSPDFWKFKRLCNIVHKFSMETIQQRRKQFEGTRKKEIKRKFLDFIDILLEAKDENGVGMTDLEIRAQVDNFMFAGHDTTSSALSWTMYNLATHPEHQDICRKEVNSIFEKKDCLDYNDLKSVEYLKYCIKESLRMYPPVVVNGRTLDSPVKFGDHEMPKGTVVAAIIYAVHHHPEFWENPETFDPLRFSPERSSGRHNYAFIPFSAGPRNCIGQEFAMNELKAVMAHILRNFELSLDETKPPVELEFKISLRSKNGINLKLKPIS